jgi:acyl-CoA synthetase (AMP-forming)/AMP-acid ligase II/acyl carrier protein
MSQALQSYMALQWGYRQQLMHSSHRQLAHSPAQEGYVAFFGGSNLFVPYSMDRQLQEILRLNGRSQVVLNLGNFGYCDSRYVLDTTRALIHSWRERRPALLIYEINPNEMPPVEGEAAEVLVRKPWRRQTVLDYDDGQRMSEALSRLPIALPQRLRDIGEVAAGAGFSVLLIDFESNIRDWPPTFSALTRSTEGIAARRFRRTLDVAIRYMREGDDDAAERSLEACAEIDPDVAILRFLQGRVADRRGDLEAAAAHLTAARNADLVRGRIIRGIAVDRLADLCSELGFGFVSVPPLVAAISDQGLPGFDVFFDEVHYRPHVHLLIATKLAEEIHRSRLLPDMVDAPQVPPDPANVSAHMPFVLMQIALDLLKYPPTPYDDERIAHARSLVDHALEVGMKGEIGAGFQARFKELVTRRTEQPPSGGTPPPPRRHTGTDLVEQIQTAIGRRYGIAVSEPEMETDLRALGVDSLSLLDFAVELFESELGIRLRSSDLTIANVATAGAILRLARDRSAESTPPIVHRRATHHHRLTRGRPVSRRYRPGDPVHLRGFPERRFADNTLAGVFEELATTGPNDLALSFVPAGRTTADTDPIHLRRVELDELSQRRAVGLASRGVCQGDTVILMAGHRLETITTFLGALRLGAVPCILHTPSPKMSREVFLETFGEIVRNSGAKHVLTAPDERMFVTDNLPDQVDVVDEHDLDEAAAGAAEGQLPIPHMDPNAVAVLQHSSGTTGVKKGVELNHRTVLLQVHHYAEAIDLRADDRVVSWLPLYHDMGFIACLVLPLMTGIPTYLMSPFDWVVSPDLLLQAVTRDRSTLVWMPNFAFHFMADRARLDPDLPADLSSLRGIINCSEPIDDGSWHRFHDRFAAAGLSRCAYCTSYAMAENVFAVTQAGIDGPVPIDHVRRRDLETRGVAVPGNDPHVPTLAVPSSGRPVTGTGVRVVDADGTPLPDRSVGEIAIEGDCVARGYHGAPDPPRDGFGNDGFRTGDIGYLADGWLYVLGRHGDMIITAGQNVYPNDIEAVVGRVAGVRAGRVVAFGVEDVELGTQRPVVLAEVQPEVERDHQARAQVRAAASRAIHDLLSIGVPDVVLLPAEELRKSSSGKPSRQLTRELYLEGKIRVLTQFPPADCDSPPR